MLQYSRWKTFSVIGVFLLALIYALPNMLPAGALAGLPSWWPKKEMSLGLDLKGGSYLLLQADEKGMVNDWLANIEGDARSRLRAARIGYQGIGSFDGVVRVRMAKPADADKAFEELKKIAQPLGISVFGSTGSNLDITVAKEADGSAISLTPNPPAVLDRVNQGMNSAIETIRRRVDELGTTEPTIVRQGRDRIVVQVPGFSDPARLKEIIGRTAKLSFHDVDTSKTPEEVDSQGAPPGTKLYPMKEPANARILLHVAAVIDGSELVDAQTGFDNQTNEPLVTFRLNTSGGRKFGKHTQENLHRPFAILLDNVVISAPTIQSAILGGTGQITGNFTVEEANDLSLLLRSGALTTTLTVIEERSIGPSLGGDSIASGKLAATIGAIATVIMTIVAYGLFGVFAAVALAINGILIVAVMTAMQSTLTLPGIAGMVLTIGMAVDSNVLIFERIREELRAGKSAIPAIEAGFNRALVTIADSQLTTLAAAVVMFWLGSGPVRGFAVTLSIGVITSVFTAVIVVRMIIAWWIRWKNRQGKITEVPI